MPGPTLATSDFRKYNAASCGHAEGWACHQQTTPARNSKRHASRAVTASVAEFRDRDSAAESPPDHPLRKTPSGRHLPLRERTHQRWNAHDTGQLLVDLAVPRLCCSQWSSWVADIAGLQECNPADRAITSSSVVYFRCLVADCGLLTLCSKSALRRSWRSSCPRRTGQDPGVLPSYFMPLNITVDSSARVRMASDTFAVGSLLAASCPWCFYMPSRRLWCTAFPKYGEKLGAMVWTIGF